MNHKIVVFFSIKKAEEKLLKIVGAAHFHFSKRERLLFFVKDEITERFVDDLLWKTPEESFLPHQVGITSELISISRTLPEILPPFVFNVTQEPLVHIACKRIYELEDVTSPQKKELSQKKIYSYREKGFLIDSR